MSQPVSPFQRQPVPPPGSVRRDTPDPLPEPQIWAAIASVGVLFAFFGAILPWYLPEPRAAGGVVGSVPTYIAPLAVMGALGWWVTAAPTMRRRTAFVIASLCVGTAVAGVGFAIATWLARQSVLANNPAAAAVDHGNPLLGMWMFLIAAVLAFLLGGAALVRLTRGPSTRRNPPGRGPGWTPPPIPPGPQGPGQTHPNVGPKPASPPFRGQPLNPVAPSYRGLSAQRGGGGGADRQSSR